VDEHRVPLRVSFDSSSNAAYIYLADRIDAGGVAKAVQVESVDIRGMVNLDVDSEGRVLGVEILNATALLPANLMDAFRAS
jgi:uncharacterized protein YuzE